MSRLYFISYTPTVYIEVIMKYVNGHVDTLTTLNAERLRNITFSCTAMTYLYKHHNEHEHVNI